MTLYIAILIHISVKQNDTTKNGIGRTVLGIITIGKMTVDEMILGRMTPR